MRREIPPASTTPSAALARAPRVVASPADRHAKGGEPMHASLALIAALLAAVAPAAKPHPHVTLDTNKGKIVIELYPDKSPKSVDNFLQYVKSGYYNGTIFHRVIAGFMIQGGGGDVSGKEKPTRPPIQNESDNGLSNARGTIAMARTGDPHSATAQFYINVVDNKSLDHKGGARGWGYAVFGKVIQGMDVADAIAAVKTGPGPAGDNQPIEAVVINKATVTP
jgi:cyclophilin family peptidyl-prolyl cis-trans isomerase